MKKILYILFITVLMITGCNNFNTPEQKITKVEEKLNSLNNYTMNIIMTMEVSSDKATMEQKTKADSQVDNKNKTIKATTETSVLGKNIKSTIYSKEEDNKTITYTSNDNKTWIKKEETTETADINGVLELIKEGTNIKEEDVTDGIHHYSLIVPKDNVKKLLEEAGSTETDKMDIKGDLTVHIYIDSENNLKKLIMDFSNVISMEKENYKLSKMLFEFEFTNFDTTSDVIIPDEVINNAK